MAGVISDLKSHARILHRQVVARELSALARLRRHLPEVSQDDIDALVRTIRRRHCLSVVAREFGFRNWPHAVTVLNCRPSDDRETIVKFVIGHGRVVSQKKVSTNAYDRDLMNVARGTLARLRSSAADVVVQLPDGSEAAIGLGLPQIRIPPEVLDRLPAAARQSWFEGHEAFRRKVRARQFYLKTSGFVEPYFTLSREWSDVSALAGMYGAIGGTFGRDERTKPESERELPPSPERLQQFKEIAAQIVASAPAFMCTGRLTGLSAAFADCFAIAMLSDSDKPLR